MKIRGRFLFFVILLLLAGLVAFRVVSQLNLNKKNEPQINQELPEKIIPVQAASVQHGEMKTFLTVTGLVEPRETVRVNAKIIGQVKEVLVSEGEDVEKDDLLIRLDDEQIRLQIDQAKATRDSAQASLEKVKAGARPQEVSQAEAAMQQSKINLDSIEENYLRMEKLLSEGAVSQQQYDQAKGQYEIAVSQYRAAEERYDLVKEGASQEDIRTVEAQVRQAQSALEIAESQLRNTIVRAPVSGKVTAVSVKTGEIVSSAVPLLTILDVSELFVISGISEKDIASVKIGQQSEVFIDAFPQEKFSGEVFTMGAIVNPTSKTMEIKIKIIEPHIYIPPGVFARANILIQKNPEALVIPSAALTRRSDGLFVYVLNQDIAERRAVITGISQGNQVEVVEGLHLDEIIVVSGNITLEEGDRVRVTNREEIE